MLERIIRSAMFRMDDRIGAWQILRHGVMIRNDNIHPQRLGKLDSFKASHSIIYCNNERDALIFNKILVNTAIRPIAIRKAIGQVDLTLSSQLLQGFLDNRCRGHPISIVIAIDQNLLIILNRCANALHCPLHIMQIIRVVKLV